MSALPRGLNEQVGEVWTLEETTDCAAGSCDHLTNVALVLEATDGGEIVKPLCYGHLAQVVQGIVTGGIRSYRA